MSVDDAVHYVRHGGGGSFGYERGGGNGGGGSGGCGGGDGSGSGSSNFKEGVCERETPEGDSEETLVNWLVSLKIKPADARVYAEVRQWWEGSHSGHAPCIAFLLPDSPSPLSTSFSTSQPTCARHPISARQAFVEDGFDSIDALETLEEAELTGDYLSLIHI